ncbi:MAG: DUF86 domain-containing protein [Dehalococcoidia bacterium]|nr:DUF86 domain-containing protein [Dehalococcoidia bacterium]
MPVIDDISRLQHILNAAQRAVRHAKGKKRSDLDKDDLLGLALIRLLEIIGEAAWGISENLRDRYPEIEWQQMANMRNRLIHGYFDVNNDLVWETVITELPMLIAQIHEVIKKESA